MSSSQPLATDLLTFASQDDEFYIPLYQRRYAWTEEHCRTLWDDLVRCLERPLNESGHYLGTITLSPLTGQPYEVIDGQQRLTTLSLLFFALAENFSSSPDRESFESFYLNPHTKLPRITFDDADDNMAYRSILLGHHCAISQKDNQILKNYQFFKKQIAGGSIDLFDKPQAWKKLQLAKVILPGTLVPERVFRRMNGSKLDLSFRDLVKNFLMMKAPQEEQEGIFQFFEQGWRWEIDRIGLEGIARAANKGHFGHHKESYQQFKDAYSAICTLKSWEPESSGLKFIENLCEGGEWIEKFQTYRQHFNKVFGRRYEDIEFIQPDRYGSQLIRIATSASDYAEDRQLVEKLAAYVYFHIATHWSDRLLSSSAIHPARWDLNSGWGDPNSWDWDIVQKQTMSLINSYLRDTGSTSATLLDDCMKNVKRWVEAKSESRHTRNSDILELNINWELPHDEDAIREHLAEKLAPLLHPA